MLGQVIINTIIRGGQIAFLAVGVTMIFSILRFANFAHGEFAVLGAYLALFFYVTLGLNLYIAVLVSLVLTGLIAVYANKFIFKRLRTAGGLILMVASLGLSIVLRSLVQGIWGPDPQSYQLGIGKRFNIFGAYITSTQIIIIALSGLSMLGFYFLLQKTKIGKAMRAISDNISLAQASGINIEKVIAGVWFIGGSFAAIGGVSIAMETFLWPSMGFQILLPVFAAAVLGGIGNPYGAVLGAFVLAAAENFGLFFNWATIINLGGIFNVGPEIYIPTGYKHAIPFVILVMVLIFRPSGILKGRKGD